MNLLCRTRSGHRQPLHGIASGRLLHVNKSQPLTIDTPLNFPFSHPHLRSPQFRSCQVIPASGFLSCMDTLPLYPSINAHQPPQLRTSRAVPHVAIIASPHASARLFDEATEPFQNSVAVCKPSQKVNGCTLQRRSFHLTLILSSWPIAYDLDTEVASRGVQP